MGIASENLNVCDDVVLVYARESWMSDSWFWFGPLVKSNEAISWARRSCVKGWSSHRPRSFNTFISPWICSTLISSIYTDCFIYFSPFSSILFLIDWEIDIHRRPPKFYHEGVMYSFDVHLCRTGKIFLYFLSISV